MTCIYTKKPIANFHQKCLCFKFATIDQNQQKSLIAGKYMDPSNFVINLIGQFTFPQQHFLLPYPKGIELLTPPPQIVFLNLGIQNLTKYLEKQFQMRCLHPP